jgi:hypothetical protein
MAANACSLRATAPRGLLRRSRIGCLGRGMWHPPVHGKADMVAPNSFTLSLILELGSIYLHNTRK